MARKGKLDTGEEKGLDMTPMIDVVFLLIIFFVIVTDMTRSELEDLTLPKCLNAEDDKKQSKEKRLILNVCKPDPKTGISRIKWRGKFCDRDTLFNLLKDEADQEREPGVAGLRIAKRAMLIRADVQAQWRYVHSLIWLCIDPQILIWKIEIAASKPESR